jgi:hypothetical protein
VNTRALHRSISYAKSFVRIWGYYFIAVSFFETGAILLVLAELLGIAEERWGG